MRQGEYPTGQNWARGGSPTLPLSLSGEHFNQIVGMERHALSRWWKVHDN